MNATEEAMYVRIIDPRDARIEELEEANKELEQQYSELYKHHAEEKHSGELADTEVMRKRINELEKEVQNYKNVLIGQGFENLDSLATESRDTTQIGVVVKQRTEYIIKQRDARIEELEKEVIAHKKMGEEYYQRYNDEFVKTRELQAKLARYEVALKEVANPYTYAWYKSADDGDQVADRMIMISKEALEAE